ncbi:hypothetical protein NM688_g508 [Phlebia brevispora]|uniref:Uncharacterized protein n=1 Tax=Phlebia brevispora TaxID=194682 RepID=A0ACC1TEI9_9APHY|nr:hypothetical protein NM688_g508 [Phlebia brevispora]
MSRGFPADFYFSPYHPTVMSEAVSALGPVDPASVPEAEEEKAAPWIVRKLVGSMTGRIVISSWETLKASGTNVVCLSPWGDSSPLLLPCIRFRDLAVHTIIAATGGVAAVAAPVMGPISDAIVSTLGDTILVEMGIHAGFEATTKIANDLVLDKALKAVIPIHSATFETTGIKELLITLPYKQTLTDASLGFYRSSLHKDNSLFSNVMDYFSTEKGWFSPYLFASGRRPVIPRTMNPDVVFCHGPFVPGDYRLGETLLAESAFSVIMAAAPPAPPSEPASSSSSSSHLSLSLPELPHLSNLFSRSRSPSPRTRLDAVATASYTSANGHPRGRPEATQGRHLDHERTSFGELPVKLGSPLVAWDTLTLEELWKVTLPHPEKGESLEEGKFGGIVNVFCEYLDLCVDWSRVTLPNQTDGKEAAKPNSQPSEVDVAGMKAALKQVVTMLVASAIRSGESKEVKDKVDKERSGIAMWRIP